MPNESGGSEFEESRMIRFVGRRILFVVFVYVCIVFFVHMGMRMAGNSSAATPSYDLVATGELAWQDSRAFFNRALDGDLGSVRTGSGLMPVTDLLADAYVKSAGLLIVSLSGAAVVGLALGGLGALAKKNLLSLPVLALTILGISTPSFFAGLLLQVGELQVLRLTGRRLVSIAGFGWDLDHMLLPVLVLSARPVAYLTRTTFVALETIMDKEYIRTAFSKGLSMPRTVLGHALRNMAVPLLTAVGVSLRFSLSSLPVVEFFFAWPGLGRSLLEAIGNRQTSVVVALASALGLTLLGVNLLLDIMYRIVDPRMRDSR